jgi:hypothetical protein
MTNKSLEGNGKFYKKKLCEHEKIKQKGKVETIGLLLCKVPKDGSLGDVVESMYNICM